MSSKLTFFSILLVVLTLITCKKEIIEQSSGTDTEIKNVQTVLNLQNAAAVKFQEFYTASQNQETATLATAKWLSAKSDIVSCFIVDGYIIEINFKNGLKSSIIIHDLLENGTSIYRGGKTILKEISTSFNLPIPYRLEDRKPNQFNIIPIKNNSVMVFSPYLNEFYGANYPYLPLFENENNPLEITQVSESEADLAAINTFTNYGFVIINTHGLRNGFQIKPKVPELEKLQAPSDFPYTPEQLKDWFIFKNNLPMASITNGDLELDVNIYIKLNSSAVLTSKLILVKESYIRKLPTMKDAIVFGNHCYSGYTFNNEYGNLPEAWKSIGAATYYGYAYSDGESAPVLNKFAKRMEDSLITNLVQNGDSSGIAYLKDDTDFQYDTAIRRRIKGPKLQITDSTSLEQVYGPSTFGLDSLVFKLFSSPRYSYGCPILTDKRDNKKYKTACIGDQVWMAENLNWEGAGVVYNDDAANAKIHGRLYSIDEVTGRQASTATKVVKGICPDGWHVPSKDEFEKLVVFVGGATQPSIAFDNLKSVKYWPKLHNNKFGFNWLPSGYFWRPSNYFNLNNGGYIWTSTIKQNPQSQFPEFFYYINQEGYGGPVTSFEKTFDPPYKYSCRCIQDKK